MLRRGGHAQRSGLPAFQGTRPLGQEVGIGEQTPALPQQVLALRCQLQAAANALKQRHAEFSLKRVDLARRRRLTEVQPFRCPSEAAGVGSGDEGAQGPQVHGLMFRLMHESYTIKCIRHNYVGLPTVPGNEATR